MSIKIDKGVPISRLQRSGRRGIYPWQDMEVGDSFFAPDQTVTQMAGAASSNHKSTGRKYSCRTVDGGVRVWRVK